MPIKDPHKLKEYHQEYRRKNKDFLKSYYLKNKERIAEKRKKYFLDNRDTIRKYYKEWYAKKHPHTPKVLKTNAEKKEYKKSWYNSNKLRIQIKAKQRYLKTKQEKREYDIVYNKKNADKRRAKKREYSNRQLKTNPVFKLKNALRHRINMALFKNGYKKTSHTFELLGIDYCSVKLHLENQFKEGMSWKNHGKWHIDHIIPLAIAKTENELISLFHYTNLQPLWASENLSKSKKVHFDSATNVRNPQRWREILTEINNNHEKQI